MEDGTVYPINPVVPANVPPERVRDFDVYQPAPPGTDYFAGLARLRAEAPPIFWSRNNGGHWVVTDANLVREMLRDSDRFSSHVLVVPRRHIDDASVVTAEDGLHAVEVATRIVEAIGNRTLG